MDNKQEILKFLSENYDQLQSKFNISKIGLFGSFAKDEQTKDSDVDIVFDIQANTKNVYELKNALRKFLSQAFGRDVDLAREKYLKPYAKKQILDDTIYV